MKYSHKLHKEIYPFFTAFIILIIALFIGFVTLYNKNKTKEIEAHLSLEGSKVTGEFTNINIHTEYMMNLVNLQIQKDPNNKKHIKNIIQKYKSHPDLINQLSWTIFSWVDKNDYLTVDAEYGIIKKPIDMSSRKYMDRTRKTAKKLQLGRAIHGSTSHKWMIAGGVGLSDHHGEYLGSITVGFELKILLSKLESAISNPNVKLYLLDDDLNVLTRNRSIKYRDFNFDIKDDNFFDNLRSLISDDKQKLITNISLISPKENYAIYKINETPYLVVLKYHDAELSGNLWINYLLRIIEILTIFTIALTLLAFLYKKERNLRYQSILALAATKKMHSRSVFSSIISYDIKISVGCINEISKMLQDKINYNISKNEETELLENIQESAEDLLNFTDDLIDIQKIGTTNKFQLNEMENHCINSLVEKSIRMVRGASLNKSISLSVKNSKTNLRLKCDHLRVRQILINLLNVALNNSKNDSKIIIEIKKDPSRINQVLIVIKNNSLRIDKNIISALKKNSIINEMSDHGDYMELAIVKFLIELHGGSFEILNNSNIHQFAIKI